MSNLDPFTQKLLERTHARKEAARQARLNNAKNTLKSPLADKTNTEEILKTSPTKSKKRQSSEGLVSSPEKKTKENDDEKIFNQRQSANNRFVVPSNAGCTPRKINAGSLSSRLANLNRDYEERFALDNAEIERKQEAERMREERRQEHKRIQEEERAKRIQERIFGKDHASATARNNDDSKPKSPKKAMAPKPPSQSVDKENSPVKRVAPKAPEIKTATTAASPSKRRAPVAPNSLQADQTKKDEMERKERQLKAEQRYKKIIQERKEAQEEEKQASASVGTKMSIFEEKMKHEREARQKEIETENRLRKKTPRQPSTGQEETALPLETQPEVKPAPIVQEVKAEKEVAFAITKQRNKVPTPKKRPDKEDNEPAPVRKENEEPTPKKRKDLTVLAQTPEKTLKNFTGSISSPQPIDCTEDTCTVSDSQAFDISAILKEAEREPELSPPSTVKYAARCDARTPMRSSTMKVIHGEAPVLPKPMFDIDLTPVQMEDEESISEFAKQIKSKKREIEAHKTELMKKPEQKQKPQKPPRQNFELPPTYEEFVATKKDGNIPIEACLPDADTPVKSVAKSNINSKKETTDDAFKLKPEEGKSRRKLRRSVSFSEGQKSPQKTPVKSGYNKHMSAKYDAFVAFDKPDLTLSKRDQIQNLLEEAAYQQNIVLQASQALNVAESSVDDKRGSPEVLEGERLLLLATEKRTACLEEVKKLKDTPSNEFINKNQNINPSCDASIAISDLKLPLHNDFVNALRAGRMDLGIFHFCVLAVCGNKNVFCTKVFSHYDEMEGHSLLIKDNLFLRDVPNDFTLTLKVYGMHTKKNMDHVSKTKRLHSSGHQSPGNLKNLFSKRKDDEYNCASPQTVFRTSNFKMVGETRINLGMLGSGNKYVLTQVPSNCPMEGSLFCRIGCRPEFTATSSGFLTIQEDIGGYTAWNRRWCTMKDNKILYWRYPDEEDVKEPLGCIDLRYCIDKCISLLSRDKCARPNTFELNLKRSVKPGDESNLVKTVDGKNVFIKIWICTDNKEDRLAWMEALNKQLSDSNAWLLRKTVPRSGSKSSGEESVPIFV